MLRGRGRYVPGAAVVLLLLSGCGAAGGNPDAAGGGIDPSADSGGGPSVSVGELIEGAPRISESAKAALEPVSIDAADPQFPVESADQFDAIVVGRVESLTAGPALPVFEGDKDPVESVMVELRVTDALAGPVEDGEAIYVRLATGQLEALSRALPSGTPAFLAVSKVDESLDRYLNDPYAGVPAGFTRYIAGAPYAAFADGEQKTWFPVLQRDYDKPLSSLVSPDLAKAGQAEG